MAFFHKKKLAAAQNGSDEIAASLRDERKKFEVIVNSIEDGVMLIDEKGTIQLCNPGAATITGWASDEAVGISVESVMPLVDDNATPIVPTANPFLTALTTGEPLRGSKVILMTRDNKQMTLNLTLTPILNEAKTVSGVISVFRDVTLEHAEEKQRADFISTASHEMRTPVAAIEGYLALALNGKVATIDARAHDYLEKAHTSTQHLGQLFQDLLTSAKAEDGRLTSHPVVIELGAFLEQLSNDLRFVAEKKGLFMDFVVGSSNTINATGGQGGEHIVRPLYYVLADPDRLREVITNLFDNACKYTPEGKVSLGLTGNEQVVQCYVRDTGPGIPVADVPHLFQKFYRVDNSATRTVGGTGLGLFICRKIIELYSGRIWVESEVGKGSSFYINLPRLSSQKATELQTAADNSFELKPINSVATS